MTDDVIAVDDLTGIQSGEWTVVFCFDTFYTILTRARSMLVVFDWDRKENIRKYKEYDENYYQLSRAPFEIVSITAEEACAKEPCCDCCVII